VLVVLRSAPWGGDLSLSSRKSHSANVGQAKTVRKLFHAAQLDQLLFMFGRYGTLHYTLPQLLQGGEFFRTERRSHEWSHLGNMRSVSISFHPHGCRKALDSPPPIGRLLQPACAGLTSGLPRVGEGYPPGILSSRGLAWPVSGSFETWRTIEMISCTISPRTPSVVPLSK
jgi:hypothetical protein